MPAMEFIAQGGVLQKKIDRNNREHDGKRSFSQFRLTKRFIRTQISSIQRQTTVA